MTSTSLLATCRAALGHEMLHVCREVLNRMKVGGNDRMLVTGLGPVGLAAAMLGRALGSPFIIGTDVSHERRELAVKLQLVDIALPADELALSEIRKLTHGRGCEVAVDCSGVGAARLLALKVRVLARNFRALLPLQIPARHAMQYAAAHPSASIMTIITTKRNRD